MIRALWLLLALAAGCTTVTPLRVQDPRLPPEARRRVADAEDAVVVARGRVAAAQTEADALDRWRGARLQADFGAASAAFAAMADARVTHAARAVAVTQAELALAADRLTATYAETAVRHDLAVYDLAPLTEAVTQRRAAVSAARRARLDARQALEQATGAWWTAWRAHARSGGDTKALWVIP